MNFTRREAAHLLVGGAASILTERKTPISNTINQTIEILLDEPIGTIKPELHGQFAEHLGSCVYGGLWVGTESKIPNLSGSRKAAVEALRALNVPVLRWPGGCFADDYHWRDGIGPPAQRPKSVNTTWGHHIEDNSFGTHEFMGLCALIGAQPYLAGNVESGSPRELRDWMEYCNYPAGSSLADERIRNGARQPFNVKFWGVGNESWGCGGNMMGDEYAAHYRRFGTLLSRFGEATPFLIACGPDRDNQPWTEQFLAGMNGKRLPDGYAMHFYSNSKLPATRFTVEAMNEQFATIPRLEEAILHQRRLLDRLDPERKVSLLVDEWGVWDHINPDDERLHGRLWQQITMRSAVTTALGLNVFHRQADKLAMCNVAQVVNVLDAMLLTQDDICVRTPSYYAFLLAKPHRAKTSVKTTPPQANPTELSISASLRDDSMAITIVNPKADVGVVVRCVVKGRSVKRATGRSLFHRDLNAYNSIEGPNIVVPQVIEVRLQREGILLELPPLSVTTLEAELSKPPRSRHRLQRCQWLLREPRAKQAKS